MITAFVCDLGYCLSVIETFSVPKSIEFDFLCLDFEKSVKKSKREGGKSLEMTKNEKKKKIY